MATEITISAHGLVKRFQSQRGAITAVDHVDLEVRQGETFGLIGPDGAGKSTTTRVILGLLRRDEGESGILGFDSMRDSYAIREQVGYIAQQFALPADMTVMENMSFFANLHGIHRSTQKKRIIDLLDFAGLGDFTTRPAGKLSGGMKKKLALACSLVHEPKVVMLDEPTLGVDPVSRRDFWNVLSNLRVEKGTTIFVTTPYMDEAERCNRVGLMFRGRLVAYDTPTAIKNMVPGQLLEFIPQRFVPARDLVSTLEGVLEVQTYGATLHLFLDNIALRQPQIEAALNAQNLAFSGMRVIEPRMEEAFISLIRRQEEAQHV
jgi:ABC-2 type transport system ATP-binding protein